MRTASLTNVRKHLAEAIDQVNDDHAPLLITRQKGKPAVLLSLDAYNALDETACLLRGPKNARHLLRARDQIDAQIGKDRRAAARFRLLVSPH